MAINEVIKRILNDIDQEIKSVPIKFGDETWRKDIPSAPGWYMIKTDAPIEALSGVRPPLGEHKAHINIPETIRETSALLDMGIAISPKGDYVVYSGETHDLKARAREHERGHGKTNCLGLSNYEDLRRYKWTFCYVALSNVGVLSSDNKLLRTAVEQAWRTKYGWPILCKK